MWLSILLAGIALPVAWWGVCSRLPRLGAAASTAAIVWIAVAWRDEHHAARHARLVFDDLAELLVTVTYVVPLIAAAVGLVISAASLAEPRPDARLPVARLWRPRP